MSRKMFNIYLNKRDGFYLGERCEVRETGDLGSTLTLDNNNVSQSYQVQTVCC